MSHWKATDPNQKTFIRYEGALPEKLYRYRRVDPKSFQDRLIDFEILQEGIFLPAMRDLNDPDEGRFLVRFDGGDDAIVDYFSSRLRAGGTGAREAEAIARSNLAEVVSNGYRAPEHVARRTREILGQVLRVACFTTQPVNYSMWANYGVFADGSNITGHGGVCIEYRCDEAWRGIPLYPVTYSDDVPTVNPLLGDEVSFAKTQFTKSREWRGEDEWRILNIVQALPPFPANLAANCKIKLQGAVSGIVFGMNTPTPVIDQIVTRVGSAMPAVTFKRVASNPATHVRELVPL